MKFGKKKNLNPEVDEKENLNELDGLLDLYDEEAESENDEELNSIMKDAKKINSTEDVRISTIGFNDINSDSDEDSFLGSENDFDNINDKTNSSGIFDDLSDLNIADDEDINNISKSRLKELNKLKKRDKNYKKNKKENSGFVNLSSDSMGGAGDFVIIENKNKGRKKVAALFKAILLIILFIIVTIFVYISLSFKFVPENVKGADYTYNNFSIISSSYKPNLDELKQGDEIIVVNKNNKLPLVLNYNKYTCSNRNKYIIFATDSKGKTIKLEATSIDYIVKR